MKSHLRFSVVRVEPVRLIATINTHTAGHTDHNSQPPRLTALTIVHQSRPPSRLHISLQARRRQWPQHHPGSAISRYIKFLLRLPFYASLTLMRKRGVHAALPKRRSRLSSSPPPSSLLSSMALPGKPSTLHTSYVFLHCI